jgi:hypothetical protein
MGHWHCRSQTLSDVVNFQVLRLMMPAAVGWDQQSSAAIAKVLYAFFIRPMGLYLTSMCLRLMSFISL